MKKKTPRGKILPFILCLVLILSLNITGVPEVSAEEDTVTIDVSDGNVTIYDDGYTIGDGNKVSFAGSYILTSNGVTTSNYVTISGCTGTIDITLSNYCSNAYDGYIVTENSEDATLNLHLVGTNKKTYGGGGGHGLRLDNVGTVIIDGAGTLDIEASVFAHGISANTLIINGGDITARCNQYKGCGIQAEKITINGGAVTASAVGDPGINATASLTITGGAITASGGEYGTYVAGGGNSFVLSGGSLNSTVNQNPKDANGNSLYKATISSNLGNAAVNELEITHSNGTTLVYGNNGNSMSLSGGNLYLWLPEHEDYKITVNGSSFLGCLGSDHSYFCQIPSGLTAAYGQTLKDVTLTSGFQWNDNTKSVGDVGTTSFKAGYWPNGETKYTIFQDIYVEVEVTQAENSWTTEPSITGWTEGDTDNRPTAKAQFGDVTYTYSDAEDGSYTETAPTTAGKYYLKAAVAGTVNYTGLEKVVSFTIAEKSGGDSGETGTGGETGGTGTGGETVVPGSGSDLPAGADTPSDGADTPSDDADTPSGDTDTPSDNSGDGNDDGSTDTDTPSEDKTPASDSDGESGVSETESDVSGDEEKKTISKADTPETGDDTPTVWMFILMLLSWAGLYAAGKKERARRK